MVWEAHKAYIRGILVKHGSRMKKAREATIRSLVDEIRHLETLHKRSQVQTTLTELTALRERLKDLHMSYSKAQAARCKSRFYCQANKCGKLLANSLKEQRAKTYIPEIRDGRDVRRFITADIAGAFKAYYSSLYHLQSGQTPAATSALMAKIQAYLGSAQMPRLPPEALGTLNVPISEQEFKMAISQMKPGKAPGPDGFTACYYKQLHTAIMPYFLSAFNSVGQGAQIPLDSLRAHITLIHKEGKDPTVCSSYRPISLLNVDLKLFTKILASRLSPLLPDLIHWDQTGFIPGREARDNTTRVIALIHAAKRLQSSLVALSTDAEKAFDRVNWSYLFKVLEHIGLGGAMLTWIRAIYSVPCAQVRVNGHLSESFQIHNGTRQGCPLSPLLFAISLEPFLCTIRSKADITGVRSGKSGEHKIAAYADDLCFLLTRPHISLPCLLAEFQRFGVISHFKINLQKSTALNVSVPAVTQRSLEGNFPFQWSHAAIDYLGVKISRDVSQLYEANFVPFLYRLRQDIARWHSGLFSWMGRCNIIKMTILPRILYLLQAIPIRLPRSFFKVITGILRKFLWADKPPRLATSLLSLPKVEGGISLPDIMRYHAAVHLARVIDWHRSSAHKQWVAVEQDVTEVPLETLPWCTADPHLDVKTHPTISATLSVCKTVFSRYDISPPPSPLFPITGNPDFPPGVSDLVFRSPHIAGPIRACHLMDTSSWPRVADMTEHPRLSELTFWQKMQLSHFLQTLPACDHFRRSLTSFEQACLETGTPKHIISSTYSILIQPASTFRPTFLTDWERDLNTTWTAEQTSSILERAHCSSICVRFQELSYKILTRWYRTPQRLCRIFPGTSDVCWRCKKAVGTLLHIFWQCSALGTYWDDIRHMVQKFTDLPVPADPAFFLLYLTSSSTTQYKKSILPHLLNAAKSLIPALWKSSTPPTLKMWLLRVSEICRMEDLLADRRGTSAAHALRWFHWTEFCSSAEYSSMLGAADSTQAAG